MFFPIGTDHDGRRPAWGVAFLIAANLASYAAMQAGVGSLWAGESGLGPIDAYLVRFAFDPSRPSVSGLLTYQFVHDPGGIWHLASNMLFLWVFGKPVESHVGWWRFLLLYLVGGVVAALGHWALSRNPVIGASGAVFAVTGLFAALFPRGHTRFLFLIGMGIIAVPNLWVVGLYGLIDLLRQLSASTGLSMTRVAAGAHLAGLAFGLVAGVALLRLGVVPRGSWDLLFLLTQWKRRRAMRAAFRGANAPWTSAPPPPPPPTTAGSAAVRIDSPVAQLRAEVQRLLRAHDAPAALAAYRRLLAEDPTTRLPADPQLELANRALDAGEADIAATAYERFLAVAPNDPRRDEVRLLLALVLVRRLAAPARARPLLDGLAELLDDPNRKALATALASEAQA